MSEYTYTDHAGDTLSISGAHSSVVLIARMKDSAVCNYIRNEDVPTVAAELLKAAGRGELAEMFEAVEADRKARTERESAAKKLQERRESVAAQLTGGEYAYSETGFLTQRAIDRIIELEDGK